MNSQTNPNNRILLAEPDEALRAAARRALERAGFIVTVVRDGADALARFAPDQFDLVIAAMTMPNCDGLEVLREIKARNPETQVILLSEPRAVGSATLGLREGAFAYLLKPLEDFRQLTHTVERAGELQQLRRLSAAPVEREAANALRELLEATRAGKPLSETLNLLMQSSVRLCDATHAVVLLARGEAGLQLEGALGISDRAAAARDFVQTVGDAFAWRVASERKTLIDSRPTASGQAIHFIGTPLIARNQVLGVLVAYPLRVQPIPSEQIAWLEAFAAQGAVAVELTRLTEENERLSPNDPLTGALKRTVFLDLADREFRRSWRFDQPVTAMIVDVDALHDINLKSGRDFGDRVLREVASACRRTLRTLDLVGRYEGDSFALFLPMTGREGAYGAAERVRIAIGSLDLADAQGPVHVTATIGVVSYPREGCASIFELLDLAREAQQAARRSGANRVQCV